MVVSNLYLFLFVVLLSFFSLKSFAEKRIPTCNGSTIFDLLPVCGLPKGLLPDSVENFSISDDGNFIVELSKPCLIQFDYLVSYDRIITGVLKYGGIQDLKGIYVKRFFIWFDVVEIKVDLPPSDYIYFEIGWITKRLQVKQFEMIRSCLEEKSCWKSIWKEFLRVPGSVTKETLLTIS